jgi:hypothetical protein
MMGYRNFSYRFDGQEIHRVEVSNPALANSMADQTDWLMQRSHKGFWTSITNHQLLKAEAERELQQRHHWATIEARNAIRNAATEGVPRKWVFLFTDANTAFNFKMRWA